MIKLFWKIYYIFKKPHNISETFTMLSRKTGLYVLKYKPKKTSPKDYKGLPFKE